MRVLEGEQRRSRSHCSLWKTENLATNEKWLLKGFSQWYNKSPPVFSITDSRQKGSRVKSASRSRERLPPTWMCKFYSLLRVLVCWTFRGSCLAFFSSMGCTSCQGPGLGPKEHAFIGKRSNRNWFNGQKNLDSYLWSVKLFSRFYYRNSLPFHVSLWKN